MLPSAEAWIPAVQSVSSDSSVGDSSAVTGSFVVFISSQQRSGTDVHCTELHFLSHFISNCLQMLFTVNCE